MANDYHPGQFYREAVRKICTQYCPPPDTDPDTEFRKYLERHYEEEKERFTNLVDQGVSESELAVVRNGLFVLAVGLLAFGRLDVAEDVLSNIPSSGSVRRLVLAFRAMMPLPENLDPIKEPEQFRAWLQANETTLRWNEQIGRYHASLDKHRD
jgi:hypothetical protein